MSRTIDPVIQEIVEGSILAAEREMEDLVERTARSPMIRDQHDYRVGLFDRHGNKLTGRSYSAVVDPILNNFPIETMREGDVFLHNDCYLSEGGIGHLPDLCSTVPIFYAAQVVAFAVVFGHHDDIGGMVPGSMPTYATEAFQEGIMIPRSASMMPEPSTKPLTISFSEFPPGGTSPGGYRRGDRRLPGRG